MTWFKVDDTLHAHKKAMRAGTEAMGLWVLTGSWAANQLTDGWVPQYAICRWSPIADELASRLVSAGLWVEGEHDGDKGWWFHEWEERQPTKDEVTARRKADADRRAKWRETRKARATPPATPSDASQCDNPRDAPRDATVSHLRDAGAYQGELGFPETETQVSRRDTPRESQQGSALPDPTRPDPVSPKGETTDAPARKRAAPRLPLPDTWRPNENHERQAKELGLDLRFEVRQFRAHAEANDRRQARWDATFRQWLDKADEIRRRRAPLRLASGQHQPYQNPTDQSVWDEPLLPPNPQESQ
jgi:hypothetical protein